MESINIIDNVEDRYIKFRNALTESAQQVLPDVDRTAKQKWMTVPILQKMNQRRLAKGVDDLYVILDLWRNPVRSICAFSYLDNGNLD